jgi:glycosyltransferase involved in cell wall biosynthesis
MINKKIKEKKIIFDENSLPTLSVCIIAKNEEHHVKELFSSIINFVDEVILVDTGSSDNTILEAKKFGDKVKVYEFPWCNDFSAARNESLKYATKDLVQWIDMDDRIAGKDLIKLKYHSFLNKNTAIFMILKDYRMGKEIESVQLRAFPNDKRIKFEGRIHEQISFSIERLGIPYSYSKSVIYHIGYPDQQIIEEKSVRNMEMLILEHQENPSFAVKMHLARTAVGLGMDDIANKFLDEALVLFKEDKHGIANENVVMAYITKSQIAEKLNDLNLSEDTLNEGFLFFPKSQPLMLSLGEFYFRRKEYSKCYNYLKQVVQPGFKFELGVYPVDIQVLAGNIKYTLFYSSLHVGDFAIAELLGKSILMDNKFTINYNGGIL